MFDPSSFLQTEVNSEFDTTVIPVPVGEWQGVIKTIKPRVLPDGRGVLDVHFVVVDQDVINETGLAEPIVRYSAWLDLDDNGFLADGKGKNVQLGQLREACNQNRKGQPWAPGMLVGQTCIIKVGHSIDKRDGKTVQADVKSVAAL